MGCIALVRCVLVLRCGLAGVVWYPDTTLPQWFLPAVVKISFQDRRYLPPELKYNRWLLDLSFVTNLTSKVNNLNTELQGIYWHHWFFHIKTKIQPRSVQTYFPSFQNRDDGVPHASVCNLCTDSLLKYSEKSSENILCILFTASWITDWFCKRCLSVVAANKNFRLLIWKNISSWTRSEWHSHLEFSPICILSQSESNAIKF